MYYFRLVKSLSYMVVTHVACGNRHTLALTNGKFLVLR